MSQMVYQVLKAVKANSFLGREQELLWHVLEELDNSAQLLIMTASH